MLLFMTFIRIQQLHPSFWNFQGFFTPLWATRHRKLHWNRTSGLGETNKNRAPDVISARISHNALQFKNSSEFNSCIHRFETFRASSHYSGLQATKNCIEIGPPV